MKYGNIVRALATKKRPASPGLGGAFSGFAKNKAAPAAPKKKKWGWM